MWCIRSGARRRRGCAVCRPCSEALREHLGAAERGVISSSEIIDCDCW
jgi:hypothetical protein